MRNSKLVWIVWCAAKPWHLYCFTKKCLVSPESDRCWHPLFVVGWDQWSMSFPCTQVSHKICLNF